MAMKIDETYHAGGELLLSLVRTRSFWEKYSSSVCHLFFKVKWQGRRMTANWICDRPKTNGHPKTQTMQTADCRLQTADCRLQTVQTMKTVQTEYFFSYPCFCIHF